MPVVARAACRLSLLLAAILPMAACRETPAPRVGPAVEAGAAARDEAAAREREADAVVDRAIGGLFGDHVPYRRQFERFQQAVAADDAAAVAALVAYPFDARIDGKVQRIEDADAFVARYAAIITPHIKRAIVDQRYSGLLVEEQGIMLGRGEAWLSGTCRRQDKPCTDPEVRVVAIQPAL